MKVRNYAQFFLILLVTVLYSREMFNEDLFFPDAGHLMLDGIFIADYLRDTWSNGFTSPMEYATRYFGQYPALSIGYKPPLWPAIQALFILIFGAAPWVMRLALLVLAFFAVIALYRTVERYSDTLTAFAAASFTISIPYLVQWGWYAMTELSAIVFITSAGWPFSRYLEDRRRRDLAYTVILLAAGVWCKQTAAVGALWLFIAAIFSLGFKETLSRKEIWAATVAYAILILPIVLMTISFGALNIAQAVGRPGEAPAVVSDLMQFFKHPAFLLRDQLSIPFAGIAFAGIFAALLRLRKGVTVGEKRNIILFLSLIAATYLFFTFLNNKIARYSLFWLPAFGFFAAYFILELQRRFGHKLAGVTVVALLLLNVTQSFAMLPRQVTGMASAADYVVRNIDYPIVMIDSYINAQFTYFMRQKDPKRRFWVIRGDKVLSVSPMKPNQKKIVSFASSQLGIKNILHNNGIRYIIVDKTNLMKIPINGRVSDVPIHKILREYLTSSDFRLLKEIPTTSNRDYRYQGSQAVQIYEFLEWMAPTSNTITIHVPVVGRVFTIPLPSLTPSQKP
jgi:hypothetical protein